MHMHSITAYCMRYGLIWRAKVNQTTKRPIYQCFYANTQRHLVQFRWMEMIMQILLGGSTTILAVFVFVDGDFRCYEDECTVPHYTAKPKDFIIIFILTPWLI